jgi:hypothetical protein
MLPAARLDLLVQIANRQGRGNPMQRRGERAHALAALDQAFALQFAQRAVDRHPAHREARYQVVLGGHQRAGRPAAGSQSFLQVALDAGVRGCGRAVGGHAGDPTCGRLSIQVESTALQLADTQVKR